MYYSLNGPDTIISLKSILLKKSVIVWETRFLLIENEGTSELSPKKLVTKNEDFH